MGGACDSERYQKALGLVQPCSPVHILQAGIGPRATNCEEDFITNASFIFLSIQTSLLSRLFSFIFPFAHCSETCFLSPSRSLFIALPSSPYSQLRLLPWRQLA